MKNITNIFVLTLVALLLNFTASADKVKDIYINKGGSKSTTANARVAAGCLPGKTSNELNLNNVRARINTGGDMWWDLQSLSKYEIPKGSGKTSMYSASLWLGGTDVNGQLKGAFQRYRNNGDDYWPGPLTTDGTAATSREVCSEYDKHFVITREEVDEFLLKYNNSNYPDYSVPDIIKNWPAHGDVSKGQSAWLAPFVDVDGDEFYDWKAGDYPYYDIDNSLCKPTRNADGTYYYEPTLEGGILSDAVLKGDQTIWWIFNDNGNIHSETRGTAIGVEIKAQAFAFSTNDEINNMTFYTYEIINRSTYRLTNTYFSQWVDTDLGDADDDYVGCDVARGLGYCYNGKDIDGRGRTQDYGNQPPAVGVDFFQGPYMDPDDTDNPRYTFETVDGELVGTQICDESINGVNFGDSIKDNERFGMRRFVYHNNPPSGVNATQDPDIAPEYYNLLKGIWKDGSKMTYGGDAYQEPSDLECDFMFPDLTDVCNWGTNEIDPGAIKKWTEETEGNPEGDRRFMQSAGEFTLESGAINYITVGIPWARASSGGAWASVELLREVDDKAQALFDNCFKVLDGPDAPELIAQELDKTIIIYIKNLESSNNANEDYEEEDVTISAISDTLDAKYRFQGYQIFQLVNSDASISEIRDADKARLVAQCDIKDGVVDLVNFENSDKLGGNIPELMVEGTDEGIVHSFKITEDEFATGDRALVNNKKYYFVAIAYSYNEFAKYSQDPGTIDGLKGQKTPYLSGRKSALGPITVHTLMPHMTVAEASGTELNSSYGDGPMITRLDGRGNGGIQLELTSASHKSIVDENSKVKIQYQNNHGPINVKVIDPLKVKVAKYELLFNQTPGLDTALWDLYKDGVLIANSDTTIEFGNEQLFLEEGFSIQIMQNKGTGDLDNSTNGFISANIIYADSSRKWLSGWPDDDAGSDIDFETPSAFNWIRSGMVKDINKTFHSDYDPPTTGDTSSVITWLDPNEDYEKILGGTWAPYVLTSKYDNGPSLRPDLSDMDLLESVDIVFTDDKSLWSRCVVFETGDDANSAEGKAGKLECREHSSIDKDGNYATGTTSSTNPEDANYIDAKGMGWFPGYAISLETGERLNIAFGESSWLVGENGRDMKFNPTANYTTSTGSPLMGGKHFIYIFRNGGSSACPAYDAGAWIRSKLNTGLGVTFIQKDMMWVSIPLADLSEEWLSNKATVQLRVDHPYEKDSWIEASNGYNGGYPAYEFNTGNIAASNGNTEIAESALDLIRVVPNPYYAFSAYEADQLDNRVRMTNLPERCTIKIYGTSGTLVRTFDKDEANTWLDWNLKNHANIPIASGIYYIHVDAPGIGETVIKWFGVLRPTDLNAF